MHQSNRLGQRTKNSMMDARKVDGIAGLTIQSKAMRVSFRAGSFFDTDSDPTNAEELPFLEPSSVFWLCGTCSAWDRSRPNFESWALSTWIEAPNQNAAVERLRMYVEIGSHAECEHIDFVNYRLPISVSTDELRRCSVNFAAGKVIAWDAPTERSEEMNHYLCVQRLVIGFNDHRARRDNKAVTNLMAMQEDQISNGSSAPNKVFEDLPHTLQRRISISKRHGCWIWDPKKNWDGRLASLENNYGRTSYEGKSWAVHRLVFTLLGGKIHPEAVLRHQCHRKRCCNPDHILPGSHRQNYYDTPRKSRKGKRRHLSLLRRYANK